MSRDGAVCSVTARSSRETKSRTVGLGSHGRVRKARGRPLTVVVVNSCPALQDLLEQTLRDSGNRVLVTRDPEEALEVARRVKVDVVVVETLEERFARELSALQELRVLELGPSLISLSDLGRRLTGGN
jgi:PleD family two-component response regulator